MDNTVSLFEIFILNFSEIANYYKLMIEKELQDIQTKLRYKTPSDGLKVLHKEIQETSDYLENGIVQNIYSIFNQPYSTLEKQATSFESLIGSFPVIAEEEIPGFPKTVNFINCTLQGKEINEEDYNEYFEELKKFPGSSMIINSFQSDSLNPFAHYVISIKYMDFYRMQLKNLLVMKNQAFTNSDTKTINKENKEHDKYSLKNIIINQKKLEYLLKELVYRNYLDKDTYKWIDEKKGKQIRLGALIQVLYEKGYLRQNYPDKDVVLIIKDCFDVTVGERTLRKYYEIRSVMKEFDFIKPANKIP